MSLLCLFVEICKVQSVRFPLPVGLRITRSALGVLSLLLLCVTSHAFAADVTLSWNDPNNTPSEVGGYNLYYRETGTTPTVVSVGKTKVYTLTGLAAGKTYLFAVTTHDGSGGRESAFSNMERGTFLFEEGTGKFIKVEAGTFDTKKTTFTAVPFRQSFTTLLPYPSYSQRSPRRTKPTR